jgi:hypothetical protein
MFKHSKRIAARLLFAGVLCPCISGCMALAQSSLSEDNAAKAHAGLAWGTTSAPAPRSRYRSTRPPKRATTYYSLIWGVDNLSVKSVESGELIRFTYRVLDSSKSEVLNDKKAEPSLIDPRANVRLEIPQLEKVGKLRQTSPPEAGKTYWMAFSNKGRMVKPGDHVSIVIGKFRVDGLVVE